MFGEEEIRGTWTKKLDRNRILMPKETKIEQSDKIYLFKDKEDYIISDFSYIRPLLDRADRLIEKYRQEGKYEISSMIAKDARAYLRNTLITDLPIDKQGRVLIQNDVINSENFGSEVELIGEQKHIRVIKR